MYSSPNIISVFNSRRMR